jgi:hypothetical protein
LEKSASLAPVFSASLTIANFSSLVKRGPRFEMS